MQHPHRHLRHNRQYSTWLHIRIKSHVPHPLSITHGYPYFISGATTTINKSKFKDTILKSIQEAKYDLDTFYEF